MEKQLRRSQAGEENCTKELQELKRAKRKRDDAVIEDPLAEYFAASSLERETKRFKEWEDKLEAEKRSQRNLASEWRAGEFYRNPPPPILS